MPKNLSVLYGTVVSMIGDNGGSLVCREHVQRLAAVDSVDLHVCVMGPVSETTGSGKFVNSLGAKFHPIEFKPGRNASRIWRLPGQLWPFSMEKLALEHPNVDVVFDRLVDQINPDVIMVDYLMTGLFIPSTFHRATRLVTITLNREASFYGQMRRLGRLGSDVSNSLIAQVRLALFERAVYGTSDAIVALSYGDVPKLLHSRVQKTVIEPALNEHSSRWRYREAGHIFFVGNISHFPNYLAVKWLAEKFSASLEKYALGSRIRIVGACADEVPLNWKRSNIDFLGVSNKEDVESYFVQCNLFIAPIKNKYGSKIKILQCLSHGTPVVATPEALSGIPFAKALPQFSLADPDGAARLVAEMIVSKYRLKALSQELTDHNRELCKSRPQRWRDLLEDLCKKPVRSRAATPWSPLGRAPIADTERRWPDELEIGTQEPFWVDISGMYPLEEMEGKPLRWTEATSEIRVPLNPRMLPKTMRVTLWAIAPADGMAISICANEVESFRGQVRGAGIDETLALPNLVASPILVVRLECPGYKWPGDSRLLGVAIRSIALRR
jgi:glycosyltransferase involved in cell wall biosynthesis